VYVLRPAFRISFLKFEGTVLLLVSPSVFDMNTAFYNPCDCYDR
jgi:hypothetical protein